MVDSDVRLKRYRVVEELVLLAAPADQQIEYLNRTGWPRIEMVKGYLNWSYEMLSVLDEQGALSPEVVTATGALAQALFALDGDWTVEYRETGAIEALSEKGVRNDPRWEAIRVLARQALAEFKALGVPIPGLLDEEYNARRTDAP